MIGLADFPFHVVASMNAQVINLPDMRSRVEHGFHLTNEEARWLLAQIGEPVPRRKRCDRCNATGMIETCDDFVVPPVCWDEPCHDCNGFGNLLIPDLSYQVIDQ